MDKSKYMKVLFGVRATTEDQKFVQDIIRGMHPEDKEYITLIRDDNSNSRVTIDTMGAHMEGVAAIRYLDELATINRTQRQGNEYRRPEQEEHGFGPDFHGPLVGHSDRILGTEDYHFRNVMAAPFSQVSYEAPTVGVGWQYQPEKYQPSVEWGVQHPEVQQQHRRLKTIKDHRTRLGTLSPVTY